MSSSNTYVKSLADLSIESLSKCMNENTLEYVTKCFPSRTVIKIIWKILFVNNYDVKFESGHINPFKDTLSRKRGQQLTELSCYCPEDSKCWLNLKKNHKPEIFANTQQTKFVNQWNFSKYFDLNLFFKLVEATEYRSQLFTIFQVCIQIEGLSFPQKFAQKWIKNKYPNIINIFKRIEQGLKLGTFFCDAGWYSESSLILSHTYKLITKWVCHNQHLYLIKSIQCLTKWLLATTYFYDFNKANNILKSVFSTVDKIKKLKENLPCLAYVYLAISEHNYQLMDYNQAWLWADEATKEVIDDENDVLTALVFSQLIKIGGYLKKWDLIENMRNKLHNRLYYKKLNLDMFVKYIMCSEAEYHVKLNIGLEFNSIYSYYVILDYMRNLFGYFNFNTASVLLDCAETQCSHDIPSNIFTRSLHSVVQVIFILKKIGLPTDHVLFLRARQLEALILIQNQNLGLSFELTPRFADKIIKFQKKMFAKSVKLWTKELKVSKKLAGKNTLYTANQYMKICLFYDLIKKYKLSEKMHLKAISIKESILDSNDLSIATSLNCLAILYLEKLNKYQEAEKLFLRSYWIYDSTVLCLDKDIYYILEGLCNVYYILNNEEKENEFIDHLRNFQQIHYVWTSQIFDSINIYES